MRLKGIQDETFQDYKKPSMLIALCDCDWKCLTEINANINICQNTELSKRKDKYISNEKIISRYLGNSITQAVILGGLEPFLQFKEVVEFVRAFRDSSNDDIVIYTGYYPDELTREVSELSNYANIIIKYGRYIPKSIKRYDEVLGVWLASDNQYAIKIS